jgi:hypothetical protein
LPRFCGYLACSPAQRRRSELCAVHGRLRRVALRDDPTCRRRQHAALFSRSGGGLSQAGLLPNLTSGSASSSAFPGQNIRQTCTGSSAEQSICPLRRALPQLCAGHLTDRSFDAALFDFNDLARCPTCGRSTSHARFRRRDHDLRDVQSHRSDKQLERGGI